MQSLAPDAGELILLASIPGYPDTSEVELTREVWPTVSPIVHTVTIALDSGASPPMVSTLFLANEARFPTHPETQSVYTKSEYSSTVVSLDNARPTPGPVRPTRPLLSRISAPRKPVIYLYPPSRLPEVTVELLLTSSWSFSAIYPCEKQTTAQSFTWIVAAEPDGRLVDKTTGAEVTYLYWEATYVMLFCAA